MNMIQEERESTAKVLLYLTVNSKIVILPIHCVITNLTLSQKTLFIRL